jgi:hypothetical protein
MQALWMQVRQRRTLLSDLSHCSFHLSTSGINLVVIFAILNLGLEDRPDKTKTMDILPVDAAAVEQRPLWD